MIKINKTLIVYLHGFLGQALDGEIIRLFLKENLNENVLFLSPNLFSELDEWNLSLFNFQSWLESFEKKIKEIKHDENINKIFVVGYSMGGRLALNLAMNPKTVIDKVILFSTHPGIFDKEAKEVRLEWDLVWSQKFLSLNWQNLMEQWDSQGIFEKDKEIVRNEIFYSRNALAKSFTDFSPRLHRFSFKDLQELTVPLLWATGENDLKYCQLMEELQMKGVPGSWFVARGLGHRLGFEYHQPLLSKISQFL